MNKPQIVDAVAERMEMPKAKAAKIVDLFFGPAGLIATELRRGGRVQIAGFGNFELRRRAAREGRDPRTGKTIAIKASTTAAFRAGKALKDLVNKKR